MKLKTILLSSAIAAALGSGAPAFAEGTQQGTSITNNVTVTFQVGGVAQNNITAADTFVVDRKINLLVSETSGGATSVSPGQAGAVTSFTVTNLSNDTVDLGLVASQQTGGAAKFTGTDNFDTTGLTLYRETNGTAGLQAAGGDTVITFLDELAPDASVVVYAVGNIPLGRMSGDVATVSLTATAQAGGTAGTAGAVIVQTAGANTAGVDTVFADTLATGGNTAGDGKAVDRDDYLVSAASLSATKTSLVISDPINGTTNPKMIPGAIVQYCIVVANSAGSATATNVSLSDPLPAQTEYEAGYGIRINGTATSGVCDATTGTAGGTFANDTVSGSLSDVAPGTNRTLLFRVSVK